MKPPNMKMTQEILCSDSLTTIWMEFMIMVIIRLSSNSVGCSKIMMPMVIAKSMILKLWKEIKL